jgi:hypothetical protein
MLRSTLAGALLGFLILGVLPARAGDAPAAPPLKPGEVVRFGDHKPDGSVTGWVRSGRDSRLDLCIEKISGKEKKPGENLSILARTHKVEDKERPLPEDAAVFKQLGPGDRVEFEWYKDDKVLRAASLKLIRAFPRRGVMTGKVLKHEERGFLLQVARAPDGFEDLVGQTVGFSVNFVPNPDKEDKKRRHVPDAEQAKLFASLEDCKYVEAGFKSDGRLRVESLKKLDAPPEGVKPVAEPKPKPKHEPKHEPKPEDKPEPKPAGSEDF